MKVAFVCNSGARCGIADYSQNLLPELGKLVDVDMLLMPELRESAERMSFFRYLRHGWRAYSFARKLPASDICHIQHEYALWGGLRPLGNVFPYFAAACRLPVVLTLHELAPYYRAATVQGKIAKALTLPIRPLANAYSDYVNRGMFALPRALIVHTETQRRELLRRGLPESKIHLIPHGIPDLNTIQGEEDTVRRFGLEGSPYLIIIGFISRRKGYEMALKALPQFDQDVKLVIAGGSRTETDRAYEKKLRLMIDREGLSHRVVITGYLNMADLKSLVSESLFVLAPFYQTSGSGSLSIALSLGKAILATQLPEMAELAEHSKAMELCNCEDSSDLAVKTNALIGNPKRIAKLAGEAKRYATAMSFHQVAAQTMNVYKKIIG